MAQWPHLRTLVHVTMCECFYDTIEANPDIRKFASNAVEAIWSIFWKEHDFHAKGLQCFTQTEV